VFASGAAMFAPRANGGFTPESSGGGGGGDEGAGVGMIIVIVLLILLLPAAAFFGYRFYKNRKGGHKFIGLAQVGSIAHVASVNHYVCVLPLLSNTLTIFQSRMSVLSIITLRALAFASATHS
jgi:hypothetical protein